MLSNIANLPPQNWGCQPCPPQWGSDLMQCWNNMSQLQQFLQCMISQADQGVTNGSDAKVGNIGEYLILSATISYAAYPTDTHQIMSVGVVPPGDWDLTGFSGTSTAVGQIGFLLSPQPAGISNAMYGNQWASSAGKGVDVVGATIATKARGSFSVPTLLAVSMNVIMSTDSTLTTAGTVTMTIEARRIR